MRDNILSKQVMLSSPNSCVTLGRELFACIRHVESLYKQLLPYMCSSVKLNSDYRPFLYFLSATWVRPLTYPVIISGSRRSKTRLGELY